MKRRALAPLVAIALLVAPLARADALDALRSFVAEAKSGRADFTQTVTSPDGAKTKKSTGSFEFLRPNRFRFDYAKPYAQTIVGDGQKVWLYDVDLNQVTVRPFDRALGSTPAALLAGGAIDRDFDLKPLPDADGLQWAQALPKTKDGSFQSLKIGFKGPLLAAIEIVDAFGQRSRLDFKGFEANAAVPAERLRFSPPAGVDVISQ
ncbi:MAG TPA: outer membrane lipoprotein chaperone LolA [Methylibium sp.]|uniref:outer membrane lipoprotein chaperone LolA n=1 Tax=Methylibium sp. TaxID=2067992 RepID=UPI002DB9E9F0|nr:outer membrane lipoprotein chaperone LolA [Methylibium sp.]HEU4458154.1 outer membrane lipoprotein chaperone LolA [Methylibium sp.]